MIASTIICLLATGTVAFHPESSSIRTKRNAFTIGDAARNSGLGSDNINKLKIDKFSVSSIIQRKKTEIGSKITSTSSIVVAITSLFATASSVKTANAIGTLYELGNQSCVLQNILFNVGDGEKESNALSALCLNQFKSLRMENSNGIQVITSGFGPDSYSSPSSFRPGVNTFYEDGGHATISYRSKVDNIDFAEAYEPGNGLQYVKLGLDGVLRLSKGIENGLVVKYAYGWVDLESPAGVPYEVVVGIARDPIMMVCLNVTDLKTSLKFFVSALGMQQLPFAYARDPKSQYERKMPLNSAFVGYGTVGLSVLLQQSPKNSIVNPGSVLDSMTIVYDDGSLNSLPLAFQNESKEKIAVSPDGYKFVLQPFSEFKKVAV